MQQLTIQRVMLVTLFALLFSLATRIPTDTDPWWHIRSGEYMLDEGFIRGDPFSHTRLGEKWTNHSWGSQVVMYLVWEAGGNAGLALFTSILATAGMAMLYMACAGNVYLKAFAIVLGAAAAAVFWSARPQMFSFFYSGVFIYILYHYKRERVDRLWLLVPVMLVWGNMHAGFSIGFIILGGFVGGEIFNNLFNRGGEHVVPVSGIRKMIVIGLICVAVLVVNPYGLDMLKVPFETVSIGALRDYIQEWQSPNFQERQTWPFIFMVIALFGALGTGAKRLDWTDFFLISGTLFMALNYGRNIAVFAAVATPVLTFHTWAFLDERGWAIRPVMRVSRGQARLNAALLAIILIGALFSVVAVLDGDLVDEAQRRFLPVEVAEFIAEFQPEGEMFNSYNWGGYLMFAVPDYPVYVDGRTDLYRDEFLSRYLKAALGRPGWENILDEDGINFVVIEAGSGLADELVESSDWEQVYPTPNSEDDKAVVFVREDGG